MSKMLDFNNFSLTRRNALKGAVWAGSLLLSGCVPVVSLDDQNGDVSARIDNGSPPYMLRLASGENDFQSIPTEDVIAVRFAPEGAMSSSYSAISAEGSDALALLQHIDFENPFITEAKPGSIITGVLTITYSAKGNQQKTHTFRLLGASLVQDVTYPNTYYNASDGLQNFLQKP